MGLGAWYLNPILTEYQTSQIADLDNRLLCFWIPNVISVKRIEKDYFNTQTGNGAILSVGCLQFEETLMKITPISCPMTFKETKLLKEKKALTHHHPQLR